MSAYKEIVTKAVVGKGKKSFSNRYTLDVEEKPSTVLGCWVINHKFSGYKTGMNIGVTGSYDINIWYSYEDDTKTKVVSKTIDYDDKFNIKLKANTELTQGNDIIVRTLSQPTCSNVNINDLTIEFTIDKELGVELVGETKVKIAIEEEEEPWDIIEDDVDDDVLNDIDNTVNEEYLN